MKVLISAYACEPNRGSEPGAGWAWAAGAARAGHDVWLFTRSNNRPAIEAELAAGGLSRSIRPIYYDLPSQVRRWKRGQRGVRLYYLFWQLRVRRVMERVHATESFDVAHHVTFAVDWYPAAATRIKGLPSVWGPVGGTGSVPLRLYRWLGWRGAVQELLREGPVRLLRGLAGGGAARRCDLIVAQNNEVADWFARYGRILVEPNVALPGRAEPKCTTERDARTILFVGRLIPLKGLVLLIAALALLPEDWKLRVAGAGPERHRAERLSRRLGVADRVTFLGGVPRESVLREMEVATVMAMPSMHDSAPWAVGEAVQLGTPVVCLDVGGPATMLRLGGGGHSVEPGRDPAGDVARAIETVAAIRPVKRWDEDRIPALVDSWYGRVAAPSVRARYRE